MRQNTLHPGYLCCWQNGGKKPDDRSPFSPNVSASERAETKGIQGLQPTRHQNLGFLVSLWALQQAGNQAVARWLWGKAQPEFFFCISVFYFTSTLARCLDSLNLELARNKTLLQPDSLPHEPVSSAAQTPGPFGRQSGWAPGFPG